MPGVDAATGRPLAGDARIVQSIRRLAMTDGDLVLRRHLDNDLPDSIGTPNNPIEALAICAAIAGAIAEGEPRCDLQTIRFAEPAELPVPREPEVSADGEAFLFIQAVSRETGKTIELTELIQ